MRIVGCAGGGAIGCSYLYERRETNKGLVDVTDRRSKTPIKGPLCCATVDDLGYVMASAVWMAQTLLLDATLGKVMEVAQKVAPGLSAWYKKKGKK